MKDYTKGIIAAVFTIVIWSSTYISTKILVQIFTPIQISLIRFSIGVIFLSILAPPKFKRVDWKAESRIILAGFTGMFLYYFLENLATKNTYASNVSIIVTSIPFLTVLMAPLFYSEEKFKVRYIFSFLLGIGGFVLILSEGGDLEGISVFGDLIALASAVIFSVYILILRGIDSKENSLVVTRKAMTYGLFFIFFFTIIRNEIRFAENIFAPQYFWHFLFLGVFASGICFTSWAFAVKKVGAIVSSQFIYLVPFITITLSSILLKEEITVMRMLGLAIIVSGVVISQIEIKRKESALDIRT